MRNVIFVHGLESSGKGFKGRFLKNIFPDILTPDFKRFSRDILMYDLFHLRMTELNSLLKPKKPWIIIGSSFGGLMGAKYLMENPSKVSKLILLAPFLESRKLKPKHYQPVDVPVIIYHGKNDTVVRYKPVLERAQKLFSNLTHNLVDDDHMLRQTVKTINWKKLVLSS
ncbi:MAG: alpha/beta hydrolase [Promethearchaeota archaeon]|jgi:alpha-beta hydrolase superfamily lysophospholipase